MAKPILVVRVPFESNERHQFIKDRLTRKMEDYHVLLISERINPIDTIRFECYNDVSGLSDIDIQELIKSIKDGEA